MNEGSVLHSRSTWLVSDLASRENALFSSRQRTSGPARVGGREGKGVSEGGEGGGDRPNERPTYC